jgi:surface antigen
MKELLKVVVLSLVAVSAVAAPAHADKYKYVYYDNDDDDDHWKHRGRHHGRGHGWGHYRHWDNHPRYYRERVVIRSAPRYVERSYYTEPTYSSIRCTNRSNPLGLILGGAAGGIVGHQFGKGKGNTAATIGGAVLGSAIGASYQDCSEEVFQQAPVGTPMVWQTAGNDYYSLTPTRDFRTEGRYCREYQAVSTVAGRKQQTYGTACMQPDGSWEIVN